MFKPCWFLTPCPLYPKKVGAADILGDVSTGVFRPLLPARFRSAAVWSLHNIHHPCVRASRRLVCASFCWPKMGSFVSALVRNCLHCLKAKVHRHVSLQAAHIPVPVCRFSHLHVDLVGPLPRSSGFSYIFTMVDRTTRWPEAVPLSSTTAADCAAALLQGWIQRFGVQTSSLVTGGPNSPLLCGPAFVRFFPSHTLRLLPIILSPMASWSASTAA
jgi:hypothetical protein